MDRYDNKRMSKENKMGGLFYAVRRGIYALAYTKYGIPVLIGYVLLCYGFLAFYNDSVMDFFTSNRRIVQLQPELVLKMEIASMLILLVLLLISIGTPLFSAKVIRNFKKIGFVNRNGETPIVSSSKKSPNYYGGRIIEIMANGIPYSDFIDLKKSLGYVFHANIADIWHGRSPKYVCIEIVPLDEGIPKYIEWKDEYLLDEDFVLNVGKTAIGTVKTNLNIIPHILLGGSSGGGKTNLLKTLLWQCALKGAEVIIADLKGGVDFSYRWGSLAKILTDRASVSKELDNIVAELERRKRLFAESGCNNIPAYNKQSKTPLKRIIFACDELAELTDKTGESKEGKQQIDETIHKLSTIARLGRAFGINLIVGTQRPDANVLPGQIKNNIDFRACTRADRVLSEIIIDSTKAAEEIGKSDQGKFIMPDETVFQAYYFDDRKM